MKKTFLISILALLGMTQAVAVDYEYVPFVREGVKWVYYYVNKGYYGQEIEGGLPLGKHFLTLEFKGDTVINGKTYKALHKYYGDAINTDNDTVPVYLREEGKVVYGIVPDGKVNKDCFVGYGPCIFLDSDPHCIFGQVWAGEEFILYDFNDTKSYYSDFYNYWSEDDELYYKYLGCDTIKIGNHLATRYHLRERMLEDYIIEGIGFDGNNSGFVIAYNYEEFFYDPTFHLSYVIENGEIIYKGIFFDSDHLSAVGEVAADRQRAGDSNYYNLMGQPVGKQLPTAPGIYIHQGKKIIIR